MIDIDAILAPIPGDAAQGADLKYTDVYHAIAEARREDDQDASYGIWTSEAKRADWAAVQALTSAALATRSKDLQLACWLAEALYQREGLPGLAEGLRLIEALCDRFWDSLHPPIEGDDAEARLAPLLALESRLVRQIAQLPLTEPDRESGVAYALHHWLGAQRLEQLSASNPRGYKQAMDNGDVPLLRIREAGARTSIGFFQGLQARQQRCAAAVISLRARLQAACGQDAPSFSRLLAALSEVERMIGMFAAGRLRPAATESDPPATETVAPDAPARAPATAIGSRQQAYQLLDDAADYLLATEPHSPVPYLVRRAIRWGGMPLGTLLGELLDEDERVKRILNLLNIQP